MVEAPKDEFTMVVVDAHVHLWHPDESHYPTKSWVVGPRPPVDGSAERLVREMDAAGIAWALNVQVPWYGEDNRYYREAMRRFPGRFGLLAVLEELEGPHAVERLERQVREEGAQGFRIHFCEPHRREQALAGAFDPLLELSGQLGTLVQLLAWPEDLPAIDRMARRFPQTTFVIDHLCHVDVSEGSPYTSASHLFRLGSLPNVYVKVSLLCDLSHQDYPYRDVELFVRHLLEHFGPHKLMWGSNYPLIPEVRRDQPVDYCRSLEIVRSEWRGLTDEEKEWILGRTASSLFRPASPT